MYIYDSNFLWKGQIIRDHEMQRQHFFTTFMLDIILACFVS